MTIKTLPQTAPPPSGGAAPTPAGKCAPDAQTGTDFLAALLAQFQAEDAGAQAASSGDEKTGTLPQDPPPPNGATPQRKRGFDGGPDPAANSNVIDLLAWVKANAGRSVAGKAAARSADLTDSATPSAAAPKTDADPASPSAVAFVIDPNAVPAGPAVPTALEAGAGVPDASANTSARVLPLPSGLAAVAQMVTSAPAPIPGAAPSSASDLPASAMPDVKAVQADADSAAVALAQATPSKAPIAPNLKPQGPHFSTAVATAGPPATDEDLPRLVAAVDASDRPAAGTARVANGADQRALAIAALRSAASANTADAAPAASTKDSEAPTTGSGADGAPSGQAGSGQQNAQNGRSFDVTPGLPTAATLAGPQAADPQLHLTRVFDAGQTPALSIADHVPASLPASQTTIAGALANVPDADLSKQIVQGVRLQWRDGIGDAKITLQPDYLGEVSVSLRVADGNVTATLHADSSNVRAWIESNEPALRQALADQGLTLHRLTITEDPPARGTNQDGKNPDAQQQQSPQQQPRQQRRRQDGSQTFESLM